jgi:TPP-dependent pyruvate/acetoin dehydrogenase alpha subunit
LKKELKIKILRTMIKIRRFEEKTIQLYQENRIWGHLHPYIGQEAVAAGSCLALNKDDYILSTHRGHGHCIAKGGDIKSMMSELLGKETGSCRGRGGSMHIADTEYGILGANGIVGGGLPISIGVGMSCKMDDNKKAAICFFGEGAVNNGVFHETLNMSSIFKLPVVFICENNLYAVSTDVRNVMAEQSIAKKACAYDIPGITVDGMDVDEVYSAVNRALKGARNGKGPTLIEAETYRFFGHHLQDAQVYRDKEELNLYKKTRDPLVNYRNRLIKDKVINTGSINAIEKDIENEIEEALKYAEESPEPGLKNYLEEIKII